MPADASLAAAVNTLLRHQVAKILLEAGDHPLKEVLASLAAAPGRRRGTTRGDPAGVIAPPIGRADLADPAQAARQVIETLKAEGPKTPDGPHPGGTDRPGWPPAPEPPRPDRPPVSTPEGSRPPRSLPQPKLILELTAFKADKLTWPQGNDDEMIVTGGYVYSTGHGPLDRWKKDIADTKPVALPSPHKLASVPVIAGVPQHFDATIILLEEDMCDADTATNLGRAISIVLNLGVGALVQYLTASGLPATLTAKARDLLTNYGITGVRSWFEDLAGPETFEIFMLRATTNWPVGEPWQPVPWKSWSPNHPDRIPTNPASSVGPNTHVGTEITANQAKIADSPNGPVMTVLADGGVYKLNFQFRLVV